MRDLGNNNSLSISKYNGSAINNGNAITYGKGRNDAKIIPNYSSKVKCVEKERDYDSITCGPCGLESYERLLYIKNQG